MRVTIVSPHLDDAVLSCGLWMLQLTDAGHDVQVASIFTEGRRYARRRAEDERALAMLGVSGVHLGFRDAPFRAARFRSIAQLIFGAPHHDDHELVADVAAAIAPLAAKSDSLVLPLGVGEHIDHRLAHELRRHVAHDDTCFYDDRPYTLWTGLAHARLRRLGVDVPVVSAERLSDAIDDVSFTQVFVASGEVRTACLPQYTRWLTDDVGAVAMRAEEQRTVAQSAVEVDRVWSAVQAYGSQLAAIYPNRAAFANDNALHARGLGEASYTERRWRLAPVED